MKLKTLLITTSILIAPLGGVALAENTTTSTSSATVTTMPAHESIMLGDLVISLPVIRATLPNAPAAGGFLTIANKGNQPDRLIGGSANFADPLQIHEMKMDGDVMKMRQIEGGLEIPAGGEVTLMPGGNHVMFMGLKEQLKAGESRKVTLEFEKAGKIELDFAVMEMKPGMGGMNHKKK